MPVTDDKIKLIHGGKEYFDLLINMVNNARESIHLQTYIFDDDETGIMVVAALKLAVRRNVIVYLLADGYASQAISKEFIQDLHDAGIHFRFFKPFFKHKNFYFGRRMHHKVFVVDAAYALVGGINIANRYNDTGNTAAWLDFAIYTSGPVAKELCILCWKTWNSFPEKMNSTHCEKIQPSTIMPDNTGARIFMRRNDWVRHKNEISSSYIHMIRHAREEIIIICSYFLPGKIVRRLLKMASGRGVKIKVIIAGPSDIMLAKHAERWLYDWLLRNKIELYEYQPTVLHAKVAICDNEWLTAGSYNINDISTYASIELNLDIFDKNFSSAVKQEIVNIIKNDCIQVTKERHTHSGNFLIRFVRWSSYRLIRVLFYMFTFYFKQNPKNLQKYSSMHQKAV